MHLKPFIRLLMLIICLATTAQPPTQAYGVEPVKIGVLAFRPKPQTLAQWQPLAVALKQAIPEHDFVVEALTYPELEQAVAAGQLDFVLTNSGHYVLLRKRNGLSSPLATVLAVNKNGTPSTLYGGVIVSRAGQANINTLRDIKGKTVAVVTTESLAGYQMQAYELSRAGIRMPQDVKLLTTGMPHDKVVEEVLAGRADVGFMRTAVLEGMEHDGKLEMKQLKILNRQNLPGFPQQLSTRLYPEWPFAAMPHIDENLARHVAAALLMLEENKEATRAMDIHGFVVPADYSPVEDLLRELRLPPFETSPSFTLQDVWARYRWQILEALLAGGVIFVLGVSLLLTNRRLATKQRKLQESEEFRRRVFDSSRLAIVVMDAVTFKYIDCNPATVQIYRLASREEVLGKTPLDVSAPVQYDGTPAAEKAQYYIDKALAENEVFFEWLHQRPDGEVWDAEVQLINFSVGQRRLLQFTLKDITERKRASAKIASLSLIVENSLNEIYIFDRESLHFLYVNKGALKNLGFTQEEMLSLTPIDIKLQFTPESFLVAIQPLLSSQTEILKFETIHQRKDGSVYDVEVHLQLADYEGKKVFAAIILDITERKQLEAEIVKARNLESLGILAGGIAHDFNNLFQVLLGNIELAKMNTEESSKVFPFLEQAEQESKLATRLTSQLIAFSPGGNLHPIAIQPASYIREEAASTLTGSSLVAEYDLADTLWPITVDSSQFRNVIKQMVLNAMEAMPPDSEGKLKIIAVNESFPENHGKLPALVPGNYVKISVQDQGSGISSEHLPRIFDPYFSTKERGSQKGMGLGLALCDAIIRKHGGKIAVQSKLGKGTTFHIYIPAVVTLK